MKKFTVLIRKVDVRTASIDVEAENEEEAKNRAYEIAEDDYGNHHFSQEETELMIKGVIV